MPKTFDKPSEVSSDDGHVHIHGPDGIDVAMTPAAAFETAQRLDAAAIDAVLATVGDADKTTVGDADKTTVGDADKTTVDGADKTTVGGAKKAASKKA